MFKFLIALFVVLIINSDALFSQSKDKGEFIEYPNQFWDDIKKSTENFNKPPVENKKVFKMNFDAYDLPKSINEFKQAWHFPPISQGWTGTCWSFSTTSFLESEIKRIHNKEINISELFTVYWEYIEKVKRFVSERGNSVVAEGSQANAVLRIWDQYGCVPHDDYTGLKPNQEHHDHHIMIDEINAYLKSVKINNAWNEEQVISTVKNILNHYLGVPPATITWEGKSMTPLEFKNSVVKLNTDEFIDIISIKEYGYWQNAVYGVTDNWWKSDRYKNVPLDDYMNALKSAVKNGYSLFIGGDVSSVGLNSAKEVAMVPDYDIPSQYITDDARQLRFSEGSTTDDHGIHIVGYKEKDGKFWFLIKDSGSGAQNGSNKGYYFYHEDYIKLKLVNFVVHKSAIQSLLDKFKNQKSS